MKKETTKESGLSTGSKTAIGAGIAAFAAAAAGAYYLYGSRNAAKNRKAVKSWALRAKAEVMDEIEKMKDVTEPAYREV
ncbi:MAG: hypothetical protein KGJ35_00860, partial [Patescibacteria group bacterium]|nr:hypothetical protein [Patescibacteria group bacterium]